jgi:DNA primase
MMLQFSQMIADIKQRRLTDHFTDPVLADIARGIIDHHQDGGDDIPGLIARWDDPEKKAIVARLALTEERWGRDGCHRLIDQFEGSVRRRDTALLKRIEAAEKNGDENLLAALLEQKQQQVRQTMQKRSGANS